MSVKLTYFVHSITTDNEAGIATGWQPGKLSDEGVRRAQRTAEMIRDRYFDVMISSDLARAAQSAQLFFGVRYKGATDARLREVDYGELTGQPARLFKADMARYTDEPFPHGESYRDTESRIDDFLYDLRRDYADQRVAIVGHQATQLALEVLLKGRTWKQAIAEDWRKNQAWQPGWEYVLT